MAYIYPNHYSDYFQAPRSCSIERDPIFLLIEEVIDYSLRHHNLHNWVPPVNLYVARSMNSFTYFNENFAEAVVNPDTEEQAKMVANIQGFDEGRWLEFIDQEEATHYQEYYLMAIYNYTIQYRYLFPMFSFACYASRVALQRNRHGLVNAVVWALLAALNTILSYDEFCREYYFMANVNQNIPNQPQQSDEGIIDDNSLRVNERNLVNLDTIVLFAEELIAFTLYFNDLHGWIPGIDMDILRRTEMRYFTHNIGRVANHVCTSLEAIEMAQERGFSENRWLELHRSSEARSFQRYFLEEIFTFADNDDLNNIRKFFLVLSFACYSSIVAMQRNRNSLVNEVVSALVYFFHEHFPYQEAYEKFDALARWYDAWHQEDHFSEDEGFENVDNQDADENIEENPPEEGAAGFPGWEQVEAEERNDSPPSVVDESETDASEEENPLEALEEENPLEALEEENASNDSGNENASNDSGNENASNDSGNENASNASGEENASDASGEESASVISGEENGTDVSR